MQKKFNKKVGDKNSSDKIFRLRRWAAKAAKGEIGSYRRINSEVFSKFCKSRAKHLSVHDRDLKRWALEAKLQINPRLNFGASSTWVFRFKQRYRIVSRSITHKVIIYFIIKLVLIIII